MDTDDISNWENNVTRETDAFMLVRSLCRPLHRFTAREGMLVAVVDILGSFPTHMLQSKISGARDSPVLMTSAPYS